MAATGLLKGTLVGKIMSVCHTSHQCPFVWYEALETSGITLQTDLSTSVLVFRVEKALAGVLNGMNFLECDIWYRM